MLKNKKAEVNKDLPHEVPTLNNREINGGPPHGRIANNLGSPSSIRLGVGTHAVNCIASPTTQAG